VSLHPEKPLTVLVYKQNSDNQIPTVTEGIQADSLGRPRRSKKKSMTEADIEMVPREAEEDLLAILRRQWEEEQLETDRHAREEEPDGFKEGTKGRKQRKLERKRLRQRQAMELREQLKRLDQVLGTRGRAGEDQS
jgi:hypothetical protein